MADVNIQSHNKMKPLTSLFQLSSKAFYFSLLMTCLLTLSPHLSWANNNQQLQNILTDIAQQEKNVKEQQARRIALQKQLEQQEKSIAQSSKELRHTQSTLSSLNQDISKLTKSISSLEAQQKKHLEYLTKQLEQAFKLGKHSGLQTIFDQENSLRSERMLAYYNYLNEERQENIAELKQVKTELAAQKATLEQKQTQQKTVLTRQQTEQKKLEQSKQDREKTLTGLEASLQKSQQRLDELKRNETKLRDQIAKAEREARARAEREAREAEKLRQKQQEAQRSGSTYTPTKAERELMGRTGGLGRPAGAAPWPVKGRVLHRFGQLLQGELRWKGLVIAAPEGSEVKAIAAGRVLLADWLQGYGLVIVIEHGKTDLSLYGYNQSVLVNVGDNVTVGQPIGLVGISGGQKQPSLYFEIRRQGQAVNPEPWLKK